MTKLILDALYPPTDPQQLIRDLNAVGADGAMVYVFRPGGVGTWTPNHVDALRAAGKLVAPIIVPSPWGDAINTLFFTVKSWSFVGGPITLDLEFPNLPPRDWEEAFDGEARAQGYLDFDYGTPSNLGLYVPDDHNWIATWIRTGVLLPLPVPPVGGGWQFVNDIMINGSQYDASVIDDVVFGGGSALTIVDTVAPTSPVAGRIFRNAQWFNWSDLTPLQTTDQTGSTGAGVVWTAAKKMSDGNWYDRIDTADGKPGAWCLNDNDVDDGGFDPTHFRPVPPPAPPPVPPSGPDVPGALSLLHQAIAKLGG